MRVTPKQYEEIKKAVGFEKMEEIEKASNVLTITPTQKEDVVVEINKLHSDIIISLKISVEKALKIGELLTKQKEQLGHGEYLKWFDNSNIDFDIRTAQRYMLLFKNLDKFKYDNVSFLNQAEKIIDNKTKKIEKEKEQEQPKKYIPIPESDFYIVMDNEKKDEPKIHIYKKNKEGKYIRHSFYLKGKNKITHWNKTEVLSLQAYNNDVCDDYIHYLKQANKIN
jgi:hypothetical protein